MNARPQLFALAAFLASCLLLSAWPAAAQTQTAVSATITDPNGIPYANGTYSIQLIPTGNNPSVGGAAIQGAFNGSLSATGSFSASLWPNASITPASTQWQFTICSNSGGIAPPLGTGTQCTPPTAITISGTAQVLTTTLSNVAPKLTNFITGGTGSVTSVAATSPIVATPSPITGAGTISCPTCNTSGATIAGSITATHLTQATAANTAGDVAGSSVTTATGAIALTAGADTTKPLAVNSHSNTQSASLVDVDHQASASADTPLVVRGRGTGSFTLGAGTALLHIAQESQATGFYGWIISNHTADVAKGTNNLSVIAAYVLDNGTSQLCGGDPPTDGNNNYGCFLWGNAIGSAEPETIIARTACTNCVTNIVPFAVQGAVSQSVDIFDILNSSAAVLSGFDQTGSLYFNGSSSGSAKIGVPAAAGTPCTILLPTVSPTVGQVLSSAAPSGGTCQTSWAAAGGSPAFSAITSGTNTAAAMVVGTGASLTTSGTGTIATTTQFTDSAAGAASTPALTLSGALFTGGSGTTTFPLLYRNCTGASAVTTFSTSGTTFGANECSGFAGNFLDFHLNGGASLMSVGSTGVVTIPSNTTTALKFSAGNVGINSFATTQISFHLGGVEEIVLNQNTNTGEVTTGATGLYDWTATVDQGNAPADTGISRSAAGVVAVGTGAQGSVAGTIKPGKYATGTTCAATGTAANPSVAACGSSAAGMFSCATNASTGTCQVNTTAVTANSSISITQNAADGTPLSVTCNTGNVLSATAPVLASKSAGASFTINLGTVTANPACFEYIIVN